MLSKNWLQKIFKCNFLCAQYVKQQYSVRKEREGGTIGGIREIGFSKTFSKVEQYINI